MDGYRDRPWYIVLYPRPPPRQAQKQGFRTDSPRDFICAKPLLLAAWRKYGRRASIGRWWARVLLWVRLPLRPFPVSYRLSRCLCNIRLRRILFLHWRLVRQPLAVCRLDNRCDPRTVVNVARTPSELKLTDVSVKVLLADCVEGAVDAALEQGKEAFAGVDVIRVLDVLTHIVIDATISRLSVLAVTFAIGLARTRPSRSIMATTGVFLPLPRLLACLFRDFPPTKVSSTSTTPVNLSCAPGFLDAIAHRMRCMRNRADL